MPKISAVTLCPQCRTELPRPLPERCLVCQTKIIKPQNDHFESPDYIISQLRYHREGEGLGKEKPLNRTQKKNLDLIDDNLRKWLRNAPDEDRENALMDALLFLQHVLHSDAKIKTVKNMTMIAKQIGELADVIEKYFAKGGMARERETGLLQAEPGRSAGSTAAAD